MQLLTARLALREYEEVDWQAVLAYQSDPRYLRYYAWSTRDERAVREFIGRFIAQPRDEPRRDYQFAITLPDEASRLIGSCGVRVNDMDQREGNIGYELDPAYWGHGYATEAARAVLTFGFEGLGLHRFWADCVAENTSSVHVLEKLGMRREAQFREREYFKGRWWDSLVYAILAHEWQCRGGHVQSARPSS
jgi:RimJ/RimL family protein N-acetyltransferase